MYCTVCGSEIPDDAKFCTFCGAVIDQSTRRQFQPSQPSQPTPTPTPTPPGATPQPSRSSGGVIAALCIVFMVGGLLIYFGATTLVYIPSAAISLLVIGSIIILCIACSACGGFGRRRKRGVGYVGGGGDCSGCDCGDCSGCDCDCGGCDC